ncbi:glycosyltransferase [Roseomonas sp. PWR1]|uniref:Glycosyltransferase n=1 Tax=Roseomonas nitratireducens TaxID=2820810 RepID=A0ABS4AYG3_9PROT|nr:glycosyltransferase family A protein [Neoroseomonas nitratireducens]MBP0466414.1 glycosyltransferase [Neoroseomonas nitratireducens]
MSATAPPFVSVIVPTHGRPALLRRLLLSLLAQDWPRDRYEVIVVHNVTEDGTDAVVAGLAATSEVPIAYHRTAFRGPGPSRQYGADRARGAILAFIDDDCEATPGWIAAGAAAIAEGFALVQGRTLPHPGQPRRLLEKTVSVTGPTPYFETCNIFYDAAVFRAVGGFPAAFVDRFYGEDTALGWTVRLAGHRTGHAAAAEVHHEVFAISFREWLLAPRTMRHWPALVRAFPALRRELFLGVFLTRLTAAFDLLALGLLLAPLHAGFLAFTLPYVVLRFTDRGRLRNPAHLLARLVFGLPRAAVLAWVLLRESVRARSPVL